MSENENFKEQANEEQKLIQNQNYNSEQFNDSNQHPNQPFNNIQQPLINSEDIQINLNQNEILPSYQSQNNIENKTIQENKIYIPPPFINEQNTMNNIPNNINPQQNIEINQNINGNFQNNNNYNIPYNNPQMNYQPNYQQNNALQVNNRKQKCCCCYCGRYDTIAASLGIICGFFILCIII